MLKYFILFILIVSFPLLSQQLKKVERVNLSGSLNELVIAVGFPDKPNTHKYPGFILSDHYPLNGMDKDGNYLNDLVKANGGYYPADKWYGPGLNLYFELMSGGKYKANFHFPKRSETERYLTSQPFSFYAEQNKKSNNVIWGKWDNIVKDIAAVIQNENPNIFNNVDVIHFTFEGLDKPEFHTTYGGTVYSNAFGNDKEASLLKGKTITIQRVMASILHEKMHTIGTTSGAPSGFKGLPDRGNDISMLEHRNMFWGYDMMNHNSPLPATESLYAMLPLISHDLIFLGWIPESEILTVSKDNYQSVKELKLKDITYPLTPDDIKNGYRRIIKVMIHENYKNDLDEYFLVEYHRGTGFSKNFTNYDEYKIAGYNKGILIWHIKEITVKPDLFQDNLIDLEVAVPYNAWFGKGLPDNKYNNYERPENWNGIYSGDYDYLDDHQITNKKFIFPADGGRHLWETTVPPPYDWYPPDSNYFFRFQSMRSDFFTDEFIKGAVTNKFSDVTRPSTREWGDRRVREAPKTHIAILDMKREEEGEYMSLKVLFNYWEGTIEDSSLMSGDVIIAGEVTLPKDLTLTVERESKFTFLPDAKLVVYGTFIFNGPESALPKHKEIIFMEGSRKQFRR